LPSWLAGLDLIHREPYRNPFLWLGCLGWSGVLYQTFSETRPATMIRGQWMARTSQTTNVHRWGQWMAMNLHVQMIQIIRFGRLTQQSWGKSERSSSCQVPTHTHFQTRVDAPNCPYLKQSLRLNLNKIFGKFLCQTSCCVFVLPVIPSLVVLQDLHRSNRSKDLRRMRRLQWNKNKTPNVLPVGPPLISVDRWSMCYRWAGQDHSGDSYREGLQEVRSHAEHIRGSNIAPKFWIKLTILVRSVG
jgi:hypothetical protein